MKARTVLLFLLALIIAAAAFAAPQGKTKGREGVATPNWWGPPPNQTPSAAGIVVTVAPDRIALNTKRGQVTFAVTPETKVWVRGSKATILDVKVGDQCRIVFKPVRNGVPIARKIQVPKPTIGGKITAKEGNVLTVVGKDATFTVTVPPEAKIRCRKYEGTLDDLRVGYGVTVVGAIDGANVLAEAVHFGPPVFKGTVVEVSGNLITMKTIRQKIVTGVVGDKTAILVRPRIGPNKPGTLADIKVGAPVNIGGHLVKGGPMQLIFVDVLTGI